MPLNKSFLHNNYKFKEIPRFRFYFGIILGLIFSFSFYSFLYIFRETFRLFSITENYEILIFSDKVVNFYNLFFAFIAVLNAQSICITFWIERPKSFFSRSNYLTTAIINDQRGLNWNFLNWFSKLAVVVGIMFCTVYKGGFYDLNLSAEYSFLFYLVIIVLFLNSWNTIRIVFKKQSLKWLMISVIIVSSLAFSISKINIIDYKAINSTILKKNVFYSYNLDIPESDFYESIRYNSLVENIFIVKKKDTLENSKPIIIINNEIISLNKIQDKVGEFFLLRPESGLFKSYIKLYVQKDLKMKYINEIKAELSKANVSRIAYAVIPFNSGNNRNNLYAFSINTRNHYTEAIPFILKDLKKHTNIIEINLIETGNIKINETIINIKQLTDYFKNSIENDNNYYIKLYINENASFDAYIKMTSIIRKALKEIRNDYSLKKYSKLFENLNEEEQHEVESKYPLRIIEITDEINNLLKNNAHVLTPPWLHVV